MFKNLQKKFISYGTVFAIGVAFGLFLRNGDAKQVLGLVHQETSVTATPTVSQDPTAITVKRVVDGDTIELSTGKKVRFIGVNTPETHHPTKGVECYGKEAEAYSRQLLEGKHIRLEKDISDTDRYGRLLRYVYLVPEASSSAEIFVNKHIVSEGYALVDTFPPDIKYKDIFLEAQTTAREQNKGLWSTCQLR